MTEWTKEEVERLANHERAASARHMIYKIKERIGELLREVAEEQENLNRANAALAEANAFLKSVGEEVYEE
jgi:hypothetical protein